LGALRAVEHRGGIEQRAVCLALAVGGAAEGALRRAARRADAIGAALERARTDLGAAGLVLGALRAVEHRGGIEQRAVCFALAVGGAAEGAFRRTARRADAIGAALERAG